MKKRLSALILVLMFIVSTLFAAGCSNGSSNTSSDVKGKKIEIAALKGPTGMGMSKLMENKKDYHITLYDSPDQITSKLINGELDGAAVPSNLASILYNKTKGQVKLVAINTLGVLYIVENGSTVKSIGDLKGKTLYSSNKGSTPEFILNYILRKNGLEPGKDVIVDYKMNHSDLAAAVASKKVDLAVLPEPFVTTTRMKDKNLQVPIDLTKEWDKASDGQSKLAMGTIVFRKSFIDKRSKDLDNFLDKYRDSVDFVNSNKTEAGKLMEKYSIIPKAKVAEMAIPGSNIVFINAKDGKQVLQKFYKVLYDSDPKSVGGKMPDENFYYSGNKNN
ncbi:ABC transporter substrate-binding protein [Clostridium luticellarii]|jgi:NitT/TauT family transport system substrate-binding protein|uniref:ABC transporter substrate-binding protein n=1 Tax=Clostridium luticellarii TaxID=1691940 RepID=UPI002356FDAC|nr:ABC transporter substrate-binding protein [Clostridium luticellarii]MCI1945670.1 PhnD/SsuA/transferrin family substrate-binding protein [Clostridium luticellarii]MCI1967426.1 PhnD/SsuA/transferrin family substrate-binding protein [Clostridium luticellarii]MCI1996304.1 PhnD/SsuA/transferrin family substrate-binding protein [Clostridium luticellarii]MCI2039791.1 PhnD/SsuA/transferrin family substrate-binding protein [Clostridium luticellarii]